MTKKLLTLFAVVLFVTALPVFATPIQSMSATNVGTSFVGGGGALDMNGVGGINVEYTSGPVNTYVSGQFILNTTLTSDNSSGGIANGDFAGGAFSYKDSSGDVLLSGDIVSFNLVETYNNSGMFWGEGHFTVTGGNLQAYFLPQGDMVNISYSVKPNTISNFSSDFTASSNMTVLPIPEPITIGLLSMGGLAILRKKKRELLLSIKQKRGGRKMKKLPIIVSVMVVVLIANISRASVIPLYAMVVNNNRIYRIDVSTGSTTLVNVTANYPTISIAFDGAYLFYWNADNVTQRGISKWNPLTNMHANISTTNIAEENADVDKKGKLWILDTTRSRDPLAPGGFLTRTDDPGGQLWTIDKTTGARALQATLPIGGTTGIKGYAVGDISWGPDDKLYISTNNVYYGYDSVNNYIWDQTSHTLTKEGGVYHAGLAWVYGRLYGSNTGPGSTGQIYELDPATFLRIGGPVATMPAGVTIGDLTTAVPEPVTICLLGIGSIVLLQKRR